MKHDATTCACGRSLPRRKLTLDGRTVCLRCFCLRLPLPDDPQHA